MTHLGLPEMIQSLIAEMVLKSETGRTHFPFLSLMQEREFSKEGPSFTLKALLVPDLYVNLKILESFGDTCILERQGVGNGRGRTRFAVIWWELHVGKVFIDMGEMEVSQLRKSIRNP